MIACFLLSASALKAFFLKIHQYYSDFFYLHKKQQQQQMNRDLH